MTDQTFAELSEQIKAGDEQGLQTVYQEGSQYCIRTLVKKTGCTVADAEDIFMDAVLVFRENVLSNKLVHLSNLKTYLFGICWNKWRDLHRLRQRWGREQDEIERQLYHLVDEFQPLVDISQDDLFKRCQDQLQRVRVALSQLKENCQELLRYIYFEQRPQEEVAQLMGYASANVVKVTRHRCHQRWLKQIEQLANQPQ